MDALSYEGSITADLGAPYGMQNLVSGTAESDADTAAGSLSRNVDGVDSGDDDTDWSLTATSTPGTANVIN